MKRLLLILFFPLFAQAQSYVIERVDIDGATRVPIQIVRSELRLQQERAYTDAELQAAVARVKRLPFVFHASYRVEPSLITPQRWVLIVEVIDSAPVTFDLDANVNQDGDSAYDFDLGGSLFLPGANVLDATITTGGFSEGGVSAHSLRLSYSAYDLLDRPGAFAVVSVEKTYLRNDDEGQPDLSPSVLLGYPLTPNQTLLFNATLSGRRTERELEDFDDPWVTDVAARTFELLWRRDTTDDPFFTVAGTFLEFGPKWSHFDISGNVPVDDELDEIEQSRDTYALLLNGAAFVPLGERNTTFLRVNGSAANERFRDLELEDGGDFPSNDTWSATAVAGVARNIIMTERVHSRVELSAGVRRYDFEGLPGEFSATQKVASAGWTLRHPWTTIRVVLSYDWE
ncbi:MAG TPA: hypothetical protein VF618_04020 [Thermoanaerobaculia bacterium]